MRAGALLAGAMTLLALGAAALVGSAFAVRAEEALEAPQPETSASEDAEEAVPAQRPRERDARVRRNPEDWWRHAREVLLDGIALSEDQAHQVDAIIESQISARDRTRELKTRLRSARRENDGPRSSALRAELRANRAQLKDPYQRIEEIRELLTEPQRPVFDMNRARLVAESQHAREGQRRRRPKRARPAADAQPKTE